MARTLAAYTEKRDFDATPEPTGGTPPGTGPLRFVVQKHHARRLHYDFRLEAGGVLKSWAVPKGPSLDPAEKRMAVQVEDHPWDYRTFEGVIPSGYGAGTVMVWDEGAYHVPGVESRAEMEVAVEKGLAEGKVSFILHGKKLKGEFALVRTARGGGKQWLLIKKKDAFATNADVLEQDRSVQSGRDMDQIARHAPEEGSEWRSRTEPPAIPRPVGRQGSGVRDEISPRPTGGEGLGVRGRPPRFLKPMLAQSVSQPFDRPGWVFEIKWDGYRAIAEIKDGDVRLYSRNGTGFEDRYRPIVESLKKLGRDVVLDGEIVVLDERGRADFLLLQRYRKTGRGPLVYYVFDVLELDGKNLRQQPLRARHAVLAELVTGLPNVRVSEQVPEKGVALFHAAQAQQIEGIMAKDAASKYRDGDRSSRWLKIKTRLRQEAVIGGFTRPRGSRMNFGALVLGVYDDRGDLVHVGMAGSGFDSAALAAVHRKLAPLVVAKCPFKKKPKTDTPARWVEPRLVCEVAFQEWTEDGVMRFPIFLGLREDKQATAVQREKVRSAVPAEADVEPQAPVRAELPPPDPRAVKLSNLDKIYWPEDGYTKGDLIEYYRTVAPYILPHLKDRPLSLNRHPDGIHGESFFQKNMEKTPDWAQTVDVVGSSRKIRYLLVQNEATLLYAANLGCIELNPWNSRAQTPDRPDFLIIDLDPQDLPFARVVEAAQVVRRLLEKHCADGYCKTSGKRGLHIDVPLGARYDYDQVRMFAEIIARLVNRALPETTSVLRKPSQRRGRIYLDYLQNRRGQTMAAPYSVRPVIGACVSTPLKWSEVTKKLDPKRFTIRTVPRRLDKVGDLWSPLLGEGPDLRRCLENIAGG